MKIKVRYFKVLLIKKQEISTTTLKFVAYKFERSPALLMGI